MNDKLKGVLLGGIVTIAGVAVACFVGLKWMYPHGIHECALPCMMSELRIYAEDHGGWYPNEAYDPYQSLGLLASNVPPKTLAGISGYSAEMAENLASGKGLDKEICSWVYWPGLRVDDNPQLALIWERAPGVAFNGRRAEAGSHAVGFVGGSRTQITAEEWEDFVREQTILREGVVRKRVEEQPTRTSGSDIPNH